MLRRVCYIRLVDFWTIWSIWIRALSRTREAAVVLVVKDVRLVSIVLTRFTVVCTFLLTFTLTSRLSLLMEPKQAAADIRELPLASSKENITCTDGTRLPVDLLVSVNLLMILKDPSGLIDRHL